MIAVGAAFPIEDASQVPEARRAAQRLAEHAGFSDTRAGTVALITTELGTNLVKHARRGQLLFRVLDDGPAIEILSLDRGPGIPDLAASQRDGYSTAGTRGEGLGAVMRQADAVDIYSTTSGTAILATVERDARPAPRDARLRAGGVRVNAPGEQVCGDEWSAHIRDERLAVLMADGLGHGLSAHDAARLACATFDAIHEQPPLAIAEAIHRALASTRGAAIGIFAADLEQGTARYCGLGNIAGAVLLPRSERRHSLVSMNGTAGLGSPRFQDFQFPFPPGAALVMHTDGIGPTWDLAAYPGLRPKAPSLVAGVLFRDFARGRDDATVAIVK